MRAERSNIRAGIASLAAIAAFSLALWGWISWREGGRAHYTARFTREQGVYGLAPGHAVQVGGIKRGVIERIEPEFDAGNLRAYVVHIEIDREVPITARTRIVSQADGVSGDSFLVAKLTGRRAPMTQSLGGPGARGLLREGSEIPVMDADAFETWGGSASADAIRELTEAWFPEESQGPGLGTRLKKGWDDMTEVRERVSKEAPVLFEDLKKDYDRWYGRFTDLRRDADEAMAKLGMGKDPPSDTVVPALRKIQDDLKNIPRIETERGTQAADAFQAAIASVKGLGRRSAELREMLADPGTSLGSTGADYSIAAQETDAAVPEALFAPWRLLPPSSDEWTLELRQDVARLYAEAAVDHQHAMKGSEDALRRDGPLLEKDPALAALLKSRLDAANALFDARLAEMEALLLGPAGTPARAPAAP